MKLFEKASVEAVKQQLNDGTVETITNHLKNITSAYRSEDVKTKNLFRNKKVLEEISKLETYIGERFGFSVEIGYHPIMPAAIVTLTNPNNNTPIFTNAKEVIENYRKKIKNNTNSNGKVDSLFVTDFIDQGINEMYKFKKFLDEGGKIVVDRNKAKISGVPKDIKALIYFDFYSLKERIKLSYEEIVAVLLHEIGHGFTHIEETYRNVENVTTSLNAFKKDLSKYDGGEAFKQYALQLNKNDKETLKTIKHLDPDSKDGAIKITLLSLNNLFKGRTNVLKNNVWTKTDSEAVADQFVTRFGLGLEMVVALDKLSFNQGNAFYFLNLYNAYKYFVNMLMLMVMTLNGNIALVLLNLIYNFFISLFVFLITGTALSTETTYDNLKRRMERIRLDTIRILKEDDCLSKKEKKILITQIDKMGLEINDPSLSKLFAREDFKHLVMNTLNKEKAKVFLIQELTETLRENELHIAKNRLHPTGDDDE